MAPYFIVMMVYLCDAGAALGAVLWRIVLITGAIMPLYFLQRTLALDACCAKTEAAVPPPPRQRPLRPAPKAAERRRPPRCRGARRLRRRPRPCARRSASRATSAGCSASAAVLLYDITQYGLKIFGPVLCENIFGESESIVAVCWQNILLNAMAIPGYYLTIKALNAWGPKRVQMFSFVLMAVMFAVTGLFAHFVPKGVVKRRVLFGFCCALYFCTSFGCGMSQYVLSSSVRPSSIRATFAGIAAAMGKLGALIGVFMFEAVYISRGMDVVMYCCAVLAALGFALTAVFVDVEQSYSSKSWARAHRRPRRSARAARDAAVRSESAPLMPRTPSTASDLASAMRGRGHGRYDFMAGEWGSMRGPVRRGRRVSVSCAPTRRLRKPPLHA